MGAVTLLTDFGLEDAWVGIMKGVILGINPDARIVDITHQIPPQDTRVAAWTLAAAYAYFPRGTVHVIVVDPGVGSDRAIICAQLGEHFFVAPDNGVLSAVLQADYQSTEIRKLDNYDLCLDAISNTFHGRDILAPVGAHLSLTHDVTSTGAVVAATDLVNLNLPEASQTPSGDLRGEVILIDHFGNIITNIDKPALDAFLQTDANYRPEIRVGTHRIIGLHQSYAQGPEGQPLAIFGSMGFLEIAIFGRDAHHAMNVRCGDRVIITRLG